MAPSDAETSRAVEGRRLRLPGRINSVVVLGSRVTVVERNDALAHREDRDVSEALRGLFDGDRTSVNDNLPPDGYRTTVNARQNGGIVSATSMKIRRLHHE